MSKSIIMSPSAKSWNSVNCGDIGKLKRQVDRHALKVWKRMTIEATRFPDKRPGSSAASNQRRAFRKPPRLAVGSIHCVHDNLPATKSTRVAINASFTTVTPFKFAAIKVHGFEIMTYSRPFNFAVSYQNYFTVSYIMYINVVFSYTNESMNPVC